MANFYHGQDEGTSYWINLDHVSFVSTEENKLILKMLDVNVVALDEKDYDDFKGILISETVNWQESEWGEDCHNQQEFTPEDWKSKDLTLGDDDIPL